MWKSLIIELLLLLYCESSIYYPIFTNKKKDDMFFVSKYGYCDDTIELNNLTFCKEKNLSLDKDIICHLIPRDYEFHKISSGRRIYSYKINNNNTPSECTIESNPLPKILWLDLKILSIYPTERIDKFQFNILLIIKWTDPRLCYDRFRHRSFVINEKMHHELMSLIWTPNIVIDNIRTLKLNYIIHPVNNIFYVNDILTEYEPYFTKFTRYSLSIICDENSSFIGYPLDYKQCSFTIRLISKSNVCMRLLSYPELNKENTKFLTNYYSKLTMVKYSQCKFIGQECIKFSYGLMRKPTTLFLRIIFHNFLISVMAIIILILPKTEYISRISILISSIVIFCNYVNKYFTVLPFKYTYDLFSYMIIYQAILLILCTIEAIFTQVFMNIEMNSEHFNINKKMHAKHHRNYLIATCFDKLRQYLDIDINVFIMCDSLYKPFNLLWLGMVKIRKPTILIIRCTIIFYFLLITLRHFNFYKEANEKYNKWTKFHFIKNLSVQIDLNTLRASKKMFINCSKWFMKSLNLKHYENLYSLHNPSCLTDQEALNAFVSY